MNTVPDVDTLYIPTHVTMGRLGPMVPVLSNSPNQWRAEVGLMLRARSGSEVHGLKKAGLSDIDEMGIYVESRERVFRLGSPDEQYQYRTQPEGVCSGPGDLDLTVYTLRKYTRLAAQGNPSILLLMFVPKDAIQYQNGFAEELRANRDWFASKRAGDRFAGYLVRQRDGLLGKRSGGTRNQGRADIRAEYGLDVKFAAHAVRLGVQGVEYMNTGEMTLPIPGGDLRYLQDLRNGAYLEGHPADSPKGKELASKKLKQVLDKIERLRKKIDALQETSRLPDNPKVDQIEQWVADVHLRHWKVK